VRSLLTLFVVATVAAGGLWYWAPWESAAVKHDYTGETHEVRRKTFRIALKVDGTLKTRKATNIRPEAPGKIEWIIEEGTRVEKGAELVRLDRKDAERQLETYQNQITQLEAELESAKTNLLIQKDQNLTDVAKAKLARDVARAELKKLLEADLPAEERKLKLAIEEAATTVGQEADKVEAYEELLKEEFVTRNDVEEARIRYKKAVEAEKTARMEYANFLNYKRDLDIRKKREAVTEAERNLKSAENKGRAQLKAKEAAVQQKSISLERARAQLKKQKKLLEQMVIRAPSAGTVLIGNPDQPWRSENLRVGGQVFPGMVVVTLPDPTEMAVIADVHEASIANVEKGMKAFVRSAADLDEVYEGEVVKIANVANAGRRWRRSNVKRFRVEVALKGRDLDLKAGTSAKVEIQLGTVEDVLTVPPQAVYAKQGRFFCYVVRDGNVVEVPVEPGRDSDTEVEVKSGLSEGDRVLLRDPETIDEEAGEAAAGGPEEGGRGGDDGRPTKP